MMKTREYECRTKILGGKITLVNTVEITFEEGEKIKDVEQHLREYMAEEQTTENIKVKPEDVKLKCIKK